MIQTETRRLRIFVASPNDVKKERDQLRLVVAELGRTLGEILHVDLELVSWETHSWPDVGQDAQDVINREIGEYDVLVGIMWKRFGTPTRRAGSGTGEEFERAYKYFQQYRRPKIMFYFRTTPFYPNDLNEIEQITKVFKFRRKLTSLGVYLWTYNKPIDFERRVREHLMRQIYALAQKPESRASAPRIFLCYAREDIQRVEPVYDSLKSAGFAPWMDVKDIAPGAIWLEEVEHAIRDSAIFLAFFSQHMNSQKGFTRREIDIVMDMLAKNEPVKFVPTRLEPVELPAAVGKYQAIDIFSADDISKFITAIRSTRRKK